MPHPIPSRRRKRFKQELPLKARLEEAERVCLEAAHSTDKSTCERETLVRAARRYRMAAGLDEWLSSPKPAAPEVILIEVLSKRSDAL